ncbi:nuclear mitotic apparatus protein 1-like [Stegodyphus dumicola]|uniref:nuclear mitotic apparatus protein 1-like n=1 Tax=Stegodyphus dumicola TaxID=202533 RepID=UPI0015AD258B|nr:nuclear mitotic apparatus protein 1-like [Stegodyphus dumicola]XP_035232621.1 nuclear mitotic apparatus protein 1-like [Stegodyphus dumicola]XP_035232622.1 nuclear mitotic apparatus protein 1-like [Stegodyphus dumicola]
MVKKQKKKKGKGKGTKKKVKKPSEKDIMKTKIQELEEELGIRETELQHQTEELNRWRARWASEIESKIACVSHLKRVLERETKQCSSMQKKLQLQKDLRMLIEHRALSQFADANRNREMLRSVFLQQKSELEGKLSRMEELKLKRNSQRAKLKHLEEALEENNANFKVRMKEDELNILSDFLNNKRTFFCLSDSIKKSCDEIFELHLPVYAKNQLKENVRLRSQCERASLGLLKAQERSRNLKNLKKTLEFEHETQTFSETKARSLGYLYGRKLQSLKREAVELEEEEDIKSPNEQRSAIKDSEAALWQVRAELQDVEQILFDQGNDHKVLLQRIEEQREKNGLLVSLIIRAANIFHSKMNQVIATDESCMDYEVLHQMRMILEIPLGENVLVSEKGKLWK